ncbi:KH domain-containing protein HEN4-like protein [Tanacetum coccineum]
MSAPQDAVLCVQTRIIRAAPENKEQGPTGKIIVYSNQIGCVLSKGGAVISEMSKSTEAYIHILGKDQTSQYVARNEDVVQGWCTLLSYQISQHFSKFNRLHPLREFDEVKRSCRKCLDGNNRRWRKPRAESMYLNYGSYLADHQESGLNNWIQPSSTALQFNDSLNHHSYPHLPLRNVTGPNSGHATNHLIGMIHFWDDALLEHEAAKVLSL